MQKLMQAFAAQQTYPMANLPDPPHPTTSSMANTTNPASSNPAASQQVMMYEPNAYDLSRFQPADNNAAGPMLSALGSPLQRDEDESNALEPLLDNATRLQKSYQDAADIESDVDALQLSINSLIEGLGLDPNAMISDPQPQDDPVVSSSQKDAPNVTSSNSTLPPSSSSLNGSSSHINDPPQPSTSSVASALDAIPTDSAPDFDFENFFNELSARTNPSGLNYPDVTSSFADTSSMGIPLSNEGDASQEHLVAFLDEVSSDASTSPLVEEITATSAAAAVAAQQAAKGRKRKSDAVELPAPIDTVGVTSDSELTPPKTKKKR